MILNPPELRPHIIKHDSDLMWFTQPIEIVIVTSTRCPPPHGARLMFSIQLGTVHWFPRPLDTMLNIDQTLFGDTHYL